MSLILTSTKKSAGKTLVGLGIGLHYRGKVGFFKPLGTNLHHGKDADVTLFREVFQLEGEPQKYNLVQDYHRAMHDFKGGDLKDSLEKKYGELSEGKDFVIVESAHTLSYGAYCGLSAAQVASALDCPGVLVAEGDAEKVFDKSVMARHCFEVAGAELRGVIINKDGATDVEKTTLEERGITVLGVIPENVVLKTPIAGDIVSALGGEVIAGEEGLEKKVEHIFVGAMTYDTAKRVVQHLDTENAVMVTGGDRDEMVRLAYEMKCSLIVLTGSGYPSGALLVKADGLKIPVVRVSHDEMTAALRCEETTARLRLAHAPLIRDMVGKYVDVKQICEGH